MSLEAHTETEIEMAEAEAELFASVLKALSSVPSNGDESGGGNGGGGRGGKRIGTVQAFPDSLEHSLLSLFSFSP